MAELNIRKYHPGAYIKQSIDALGISEKEFSQKSGISEATLSNILLEKEDITPSIANKLATFFGTSSSVWINMQNGYDLQNNARSI